MKRYRKHTRRLFLESLEDRRLMAVDWRNPVNSLDVSGDGFISPLDALQPINELNDNGSHALADQRPTDKAYWDASGDQFISPLDALQVINALNSNQIVPYVLGEGQLIAAEQSVTITIGQAAGTRTYRLQVTPNFDTTDAQASSDDLFAIYLVDPQDPATTLLDRGTPGTTLFTLSESGAEFVPGRVRWDGQIVEIDLSELTGRDTAELRLQLLNTDGDRGSRVAVRPLTNEVDVAGVIGPRMLDLATPTAAGVAVNLTSLTAANDVNVHVENVRFSSVTHRYTAELRLQNAGDSLGRSVAVAFPDLPSGVTLRNPSGTTADGDPYINFAPAIGRGGLSQNGRSELLLVEFDGPSRVPFALAPQILAGTNQPPTLAAIGPLSVMPGGKLATQLTAADPDGDAITFSLSGATGSASVLQNLPTGTLHGDGLLEFSPEPDELGQYTFDVIASDGVLTARQTVALDVVTDPTTTTRVSGFLLDVDRSPLAGMQVEIGGVQGLTQSDGSFTLDLGSGPVVGDTLKVRGELFPGPLVYPFIAEKLAFILEHDVFAGVNNVIDRPIFLPPLDVAGGTTIDPMQDIVVQQEVAPGETVEVFVAAGTLMNQQGTPFTGTLSITEVPPDLTPAALPSIFRPDLVVTIQPGEMVFASPAPLKFPNRNGWPADTKMDLWSISPVTGEFEDVGDMQVSADGNSVETISGGIRNSSWHFFVPIGPPIGTPPAQNPRNIKASCLEHQCKVNANSEVELHSGAVLETHDSVSYHSLGVDRSWQLTYDSLRADPRPIVHFSLNGSGLAVESLLMAEVAFRRGNFRFEIPGYSGGEFGFDGGQHFWSIAAGSRDAISDSLQAELREQPSGRYDYDLRLSQLVLNGFTGTAVPLSGSVLHVNSTESQFGAGWGLSGLHELVENPDGSVLYIDGDGSELLFQRAAPVASDFRSDNEGWRLIGGGGTVAIAGSQAPWFAAGGNPGGNLSFLPRIALSGPVYFSAPANFLDRPVAYGETLSFDLQQVGSAGGADLILRGGGTTLVLDNVINPSQNWSTYSVPLTNAMDWRLGSLDGPPVTRSQLEAVLANLTEVAIRANEASLDNVRLSGLQGNPFLSAPGDFSTFEQLPGGNFRRTTKDQTVYTFNAQNRLASVRDRNGNETTFSYDSAARLTKITDPVGLESTFTIGANGKVAAITDPANCVTEFSYDAVGNLTRITDPDDSVRTFSYDTAHHMTGEIDQRGQSEQMFYDFAGRASQTIRKDGTTQRFDPVQVQGLLRPEATIDLLNPPPAGIDLPPPAAKTSDGNGNMKEIGLDQFGQFTSASDDEGEFPSVVRDGQLQVTSQVDARGNPTYFRYDERGNLVESFDSISAPTVFVLRPFDDPLTDQLLVDSLVAEGILPTLGPVIEEWDGTQTDLVRFDPAAKRIVPLYDALLILDNPAVEATVASQEAIIEYVQMAGGGLIVPGRVASLSSSSWSTLQPFLPTVSFFPFANGGITTYSQITADPIINAGLPANFDIQTTVEMALGRPDPPDPTFPVFYESSQSQFSGLVGFDQTAINGSRQLVFSVDILRQLGSNEFRHLLGNSVRWVSHDGSSSAAMQMTYEPDFNQLTSMTDGIGRQILHEIDPANGNMLSMTEVVGAAGGTDDVITRYTYTPQGLIDTVTDPLGRVTNYDYDTRGRLISMTMAQGTPDQGVTQYEYDDAGNVTTSIDPNGNRTLFEYDLLNRPVRMTEADPDGATGPLESPITSLSYDAAGNVLSTTDSRGNETEFEYDARNRVINTTDARTGVTQYSYDQEGNLASRRDELGHETRQRYDARNRLIESIDPDGGSTRYEYDADNDTTGIIDPVGNRTSYRLDARSRVIEEIDPLGKSIVYRFDEADQLTAKIDRLDRTTLFVYDDLSRLTTETWMLGVNLVQNEINYAYNPVSDLTSVADAFGSLAFTYDARDRVRTVDNGGSPLGAPRVVLDYQYDPAGNRLSMADTINGAVGAVNVYQYDDLNRTTRITLAAATGAIGTLPSTKRIDLEYNPLGQLAGIQRFADLAGLLPVVATTHTYDSLNRLTDITHRDAATTLAFEQLTYDDADRITQIVNSDGTSNYSYDDRDQLTGADHTPVGTPNVLPDETYGYDANGNRVSSSVHGSGYQTGPGNRLLSDGTYNYAYDDEGNMIRRTEIATGNKREFQYDHRNRLMVVEDKDSANTVLKRTVFLYDAFNRRVYRYTDDTPDDHTSTFVEQFVYDGENVLLDFTDPDGDAGAAPLALDRRYLHGPAVDQVFAQDDGSGDVSWYLTDHLGSTTALVDNAGDVRNHIVYESFGNVVSQSDPAVDTRYLYTGREFEPELDLYYYRARFYDAVVGRFLSEDPIGFSGGDANLFRYGSNNPLSNTDPFGEECPERRMGLPRPGTIRIRSLEGDVGIRSPRQEWREANLGDVVGPEDEVQTGSASRLVLEFDDGDVVEINEVTFLRLHEIADPNTRTRARYKLRLGDLKAEVKPQVTIPSDYSIQRFTVTSSVRG